MAAWKEILRRGAYLRRRSQFERELDDEIQFHIETRAEELRSEGVPLVEAVERARREFGPRARMSEDTRGAWQFRWLEDLWRDLRYALRAFAKSPGFAAIAVLSLAMGVGANCGMFILVDAMLLRPLAVPRSSEVVTVYETTPAGTTGASYREYKELRERNRSFASLTAFEPVNIGFATHAGAVPHGKDGQLVAGNYFDLLEVKPEWGRSFLPEEDQVPVRDAVVILSHDLWVREFAADPAVLGKQAWIGGSAFTIVGILPARFATIDEDLMEDYPEYYVPLMMAPRIGNNPDILEKPEVRNLTVLGRLRSGIAIQQAQAEMTGIAANLEKQYPESGRNRSIAVQTVRRYRTAGAGGSLGIMVMTLAVAVLLVACFNVAGLLTSRSAGRAREIALRLAVGAGRARLIRQLLTESLLLAAAGGVAGLAIGYIPALMMKRIMTQIDPNLGTIADSCLG